MIAIPGQRFVSATESDLGLGVVTEVDGRRVSILFPAADERRVYVLENAPLSRIQYAVGDVVHNVNDEAFRVRAVREHEGLLIYSCLDQRDQSAELLEIDLSPFVQITTPLQRLVNGQADSAAAHRLRVETLYHTDRLQRSQLRGLRGGRVSLLEHQVHIAYEVAQRHAPRVLLADEVGLGKTIEAGMIAHHQIITGRASRVLILVPDSLLHQWLVEMLRRFNLSFALFDEARFAALIEEGYANPFEHEQQVLCPLSLLSQDQAMQDAAVAAGWDLLVVDEAHHLQWPATAGTAVTPSERAYQCVERLAQHCAGLLLLTATPEQLGVASHFARLRLLDPARFHDLAAYREEENGYRAVSDSIAPLLEGSKRLSTAQRDALRAYTGAAVPATLTDSQREKLLRDLLDRHGTGRVFFRNTRAAIPDFPGREVTTYALAAPDLYTQPPASIDAALYPESTIDSGAWLTADPRVRWLAELIRSLRGQKVLIICHHMATAKALDEHLTLREGLRTTSFYEGLSLVERDRAAAYFAEGRDDEGGGAHALICSEIGSEGRNFQFAHHLVLFDLPQHPDLLEQRIGRLDRIGQSETIRIHVPYLADTAQATMLAWYHEGLGNLQHSFYAGHVVYQEFAARLEALLLAGAAPDASVRQLVLDTAALASETRARLKAGRDRLIEHNSCNRDRARELIGALEEEDASSELQAYLDLAFEQYGLDCDFHSEDAVVIHPGERMTVAFPGVPEDGLTATYSRAKALAREDMHYLSWEHPIVDECLTMTRQSELGNATVATMSIATLPAGTLLLEAYFTVAVVAPRHLQLERYLSLQPQRLLIVAGGKDVSATLNRARLDLLCKEVDTKTARAVLRKVRVQVADLLAHAEAAAQPALEQIRTRARAQIEAQLGSELERLVTLAQVNPSIRRDEIDYAATTVTQCHDFAERAQLRLDALRLIVNA